MAITATEALTALKRAGRSIPAKALADYIGTTDSRAVATAMRGPVRDGRATITYRKGVGWYRFKRLSVPNAIELTGAASPRPSETE